MTIQTSTSSSKARCKFPRWCAEWYDTRVTTTNSFGQLRVIFIVGLKIRRDVHSAIRRIEPCGHGKNQNDIPVEEQARSFFSRVDQTVIDMPFGDEREKLFPSRVEGRIFLRRETGCGEFSMNIPKTYPLEGRMQMRWNVKIAAAKWDRISLAD